jgi:mycoredoxin
MDLLGSGGEDDAGALVAEIIEDESIMTESTSTEDKITLFTSSWCAHAISVDSFLRQNNVSVDRIDIDEVPGARQRLVELNGGFASVPTLIFPDGTKLTEPSLLELRRKLKLSKPGGLIGRLRSMVGRVDGSSE